MKALYLYFSIVFFISVQCQTNEIIGNDENLGKIADKMKPEIGRFPKDFTRNLPGVVRDESRRWPSPKIPYEISPNTSNLI